MSALRPAHTRALLHKYALEGRCVDVHASSRSPGGGAPQTNTSTQAGTAVWHPLAACTYVEINL